MAEKTTLQVTPRTILGKATKQLRRDGKIPANISGHKEDPVAVQIDAHTFDTLMRKHATRSVLTLQTPDGEETVLVRHVQHNPKSGKVVHVDFSRVSLSERIHAKVPLHFVGEAPGVKVEGGVLLQLLESLEVECQAANILESLEIDTSALTEIGSALHAKDVKLPANTQLLTDPEELIVKIEAPRVQEEVEQPAASTEDTAEATPTESPAEE